MGTKGRKKNINEDTHLKTTTIIEVINLWRLMISEYNFNGHPDECSEVMVKQ